MRSMYEKDGKFKRSVDRKSRLIQVLYERYQSVYRVAEHPKVKMSPTGVYRRLKRCGITKPRGFRRRACKDCWKPTNGKMRCPLHTRLRNAELNRLAVHRYKKKLRANLTGGLL